MIVMLIKLIFLMLILGSFILLKMLLFFFFIVSSKIDFVIKMSMMLLKLNIVIIMFYL